MGSCMQYPKIPSLYHGCIYLLRIMTQQTSLESRIVFIYVGKIYSIGSNECQGFHCVCVSVMRQLMNLDTYATLCHVSIGLG
jgi:hypothetical protein